MSSKWGPVAAGIMTLILSGCRGKDTDKAVYSDFAEIASDGWAPENVISFEPMPRDSDFSQANRYDLEVVWRVSQRHNVRKFPAVVIIEDESGIISKDTLEIDMTGNNDSDARLRSQLGVSELTMKVDSGFTLKDGYALTLYPLAEKEATKGLLNVGVRLIRTSNPEK